jgi:prevent-host-death family protein
MQVNVHEAKTKLSQLLERVEAGEDVVIARAGRPVARLIRVQPAAFERKLGQYAGEIRIAPDFDELPPEWLAAFEGDSEPPTSGRPPKRVSKRSAKKRRR